MCSVCAMGVCVGVCGSVDLLVCWHAGTPRFNILFYFLYSACCCCCCSIMSCITPRFKLSSSLPCGCYGANSSRTARSCGPLLCLCWHCICLCDVCAMIRKHVAHSTLPTLLCCTEGKNTAILLNTTILFASSNTAAHVPCFLQRKP